MVVGARETSELFECEFVNRNCCPPSSPRSRSRSARPYMSRPAVALAGNRSWASTHTAKRQSVTSVTGIL
eukprot:2266040-Rhodomonas_salina.1